WNRRFAVLRSYRVLEWFATNTKIKARAHVDLNHLIGVRDMTHQFQYSDAVHESVDNVPDEVEDISETSIGDSMTSDKEVFSPINKPTFIFEIQTLDRKVQFGCEDSSIMNEWIAAVQLLANYVREREFSEVDVTIAPTQLQKNKIKIDPVIF
ncbi:hypothetical protein RFI_33686, partial [Reticulomyxa filosa]